MSGNLEQSQRYSEQLVLYMKATNLLKSTLKDVELEVASSSQEPPEDLKKGEPKLAMMIWTRHVRVIRVLEQDKARELQTFCHSEAMRAARLVQSISEQKNEQLVSYVRTIAACNISATLCLVYVIAYDPVLSVGHISQL